MRAHYFAWLLSVSAIGLSAQQHDSHQYDTHLDTAQDIESTKLAPKQSAVTQSAITESVLPQTVQLYSCPMHPHIQQHEPGNCPICGMTLVAKSAPMNAQLQVNGAMQQALAISSARKSNSIAAEIGSRSSIAILALGSVTPLLLLLIYLPPPALLPQL